MRRRILTAAILLLSSIAALGGSTPAQAVTAPVVVQAYYMTATTVSGLENQAYNDAHYFAAHNPNANRVLILDFGAARCISGNCGTHNTCPVTGATYGAEDFGSPNTFFTNGDILNAMESASQGLHDGYTSGINIIAYGTNNSNFTGMTYQDICSAGYYQSERVSSLASYETSHGYVDQGATAASDIEPSYSGPVQAQQLVNGDTNQGYALYWDYGSADGCPTSGSGGCNNGWSQHDVGYVSFDGAAVPLPEIYNISANASQWTVIAHQWGNGYFFEGATGAPPTSTAQAGWLKLYNDFSGTVDRQLSCFGC